MPTRAGRFDEAVFALQAIAEYDIEFCEQPMRTWYNDRLPELMRYRR
jgi:L-alanine-DL-glutamate epimerase-like enolase superfamily enzyme